MKKRLIALLMVATMVVAGFAACGKKDTETSTKKEATVKETTKAEVQDVSLKVWAPKEEQEILAQMLDNFKAKHPEYNLTFDTQPLSESDAYGELSKDPEVAADVFMFASDQLPKMVEAGLIYPITLNIDKVKAAHGPAAIAAATIGDQLYAHPFTPNSWFMYYNKSMYTEEEVKSLDTMMAKDLGDGVYNFCLDIDNSWYLPAFFFANGCTLFGADGTDDTACDFNNEKGVAAANYLINLAASKKFVDFDADNDIALLADGKLGATCSGTWTAENIKKALGDNFAATKLPTVNIGGSDVQLSNFADFKLVGVKANTKFAKPAMELAEYLGGEECQKLRFEKRSLAPTITALSEDPDVQANQAVYALSTQTPLSTLQPRIPQMTNFWAPVAAFGAELKEGTITKDNVQGKLDTMVEQILSKIG